MARESHSLEVHQDQILVIMLKTPLFFLFVLSISIFANCASDDGDSPENESTGKASGTIQLSGEETSEFGNSLTVANIAVAQVGLTGTDKSVMLLSENIRVENNELVYTNDQNGFVIVAADFSTGGSPDIEKTISMTIVKDGEEFRHACSSPYQGFFTACGDGYSIDFNAKKVVFNGTTVINTDSDVVLTMDGIVTWE